MDLIFRHNERLRQGAEFTQLKIDDPLHPLILVDPDANEAFLVSVDSIGTFSVRVLDLNEWNNLAKIHKLSSRPGFGQLGENPIQQRSAAADTISSGQSAILGSGFGRVRRVPKKRKKCAGGNNLAVRL